MNRLIFIRIIKTLMMTAPFLFMSLMLSSLWGVVGKATYADLLTNQQNEFGSPEAKNYPVSSTKNRELCTTTELKNPETSGDEENNDTPNKAALPEKIDWEHVV